MNPKCSGQDVLRCRLCEAPVPPFSCEECHIYLCKRCVVDHILDESTYHKVVPIKQTLSAFIYPKCSRHSSMNCKLYCEVCTIPVCLQCASSKEHHCHGFTDLLECVKDKKEVSKKDIQKLETSILTEHKQCASHILNQKVDLSKTLGELEAAIDEHGEKLHRQVSDVVAKFKFEIFKKYNKRFEELTEAEKKITQSISEIEQCILMAKEIQSSRDLGLVFEYKSYKEEFRNMPPRLNVTLPKFVAYTMETNKLSEQFGSFKMAINHGPGAKRVQIKPKAEEIKQNQVYMHV